MISRAMFIVLSYLRLNARQNITFNPQLEELQNSNKYPITRTTREVIHATSNELGNRSNKDTNQS